MSKRGFFPTHHLPSALPHPSPPNQRPRPNRVSQQQVPACATWGMPGPGPSGTLEDSLAASTSLLVAPRWEGHSPPHSAWEAGLGMHTQGEAGEWS